MMSASMLKFVIASIKNMMRAEIKTCQACMCFNINVLENACFGCETVNFNAKQIKEIEENTWIAND